MMKKKFPLQGIKVLELARVLAGPWAGQLLADLGAEVIKIEQPVTGDPLRKFGSASPTGDSYTWLSEQRNKKSITLDLRKPAGIKIVSFEY